MSNIRLFRRGPARLADLPARQRGAAEVSVVASLHGLPDRPVRDAVLREVPDDGAGGGTTSIWGGEVPPPDTPQTPE